MRDTLSVLRLDRRDTGKHGLSFRVFRSFAFSRFKRHKIARPYPLFNPVLSPLKRPGVIVMERQVWYNQNRSSLPYSRPGTIPKASGAATGPHLLSRKE